MVGELIDVGFYLHIYGRFSYKFIDSCDLIFNGKKKIKDDTNLLFLNLFCVVVVLLN